MKQDLSACPVEIAMGLIGDKWKILIIRDLLTGTKRFGELKKSLNGISQKVLTNTLRDMEKSGLVHREVFAEVPPRVEYSLTDTGWSLKPILDSMVKWEIIIAKCKNSRIFLLFCYMSIKNFISLDL